MGEYRAYSTPTATLDLMAGVRVWSINNDIALALAAGARRCSLERDGIV
jgi:hypothetical protein